MISHSQTNTIDFDAAKLQRLGFSGNRNQSLRPVSLAQLRQQLTLQLQQAELSRFAQVLTRHWQNLAYGHQLPPDNLKRGLCEAWRRLCTQQVPT